MKKLISCILAGIILVVSCNITTVFATNDEVTNVALGKSVRATSEWPGFLRKYVTDGNKNTSWSMGGAGTRLEPNDAQGNQWIMIDLGARYDITSMIAYSRSDVNSASERMGWLYQIAESEDFSDGVTIGQKNSPGTAGQGYEVSLKKPVTGRYVRVACAEYFVIAEIEVYGTLAPEKAKGEYDDIAPEGDLYNASQLAWTLNIMEGITPIDFGVGHLMTRGEAAEAAARLGGSGELDWAQTGFSDVDFEHDKSGYISWCEKNGIVSSAPFFRPDEFITGTEFVAMLLRLNGWWTLAEGGEYPYNVINAAQKTNLTKHVDINLSAPLNKSRAILLVYNMLTGEIAVPSWVNDKGVAYTAGDSYLEEVLGLVLAEGIVDTIRLTDLIEPQTKPLSYASINGIEYIDDSGMVSKFLGEKVWYLTDKDNRITHIWRNPDIGTRLTVMSDDIVRSDNSSLIYYEDGSDKEKKLAFESNVYFIKNGVASGDFRLNNLKRTNGKIVLIDNDGNKKIDVIKLYEPKVIVTDYIGVDGSRLSIGAQNGDSLEVPDFDELIVTKNGFDMPYTEIPSGSLIYAYVSDNKKHVELEVSLESVSGIVETITDDGIEVDGEFYEFSKYYTVNSAIIDDIVAGADMTFILDENGLIVWAVNDTVTALGETLSVILGIHDGGGFEPFMIKVFNERSEFLTLTLANQVTIDGRKLGKDGISSLGNSYFEGKAAIYRLNSNGLVTYINTENRNQGEAYDKLAPQNKWSLPSGSGRAAMGFYKNTQMVFPLYEDFPVFTIPKDSVSGKVIVDDLLQNRFSYKTIYALYPASSDVESSGTFVFYGEADKNSPDFAVRFININTNLSLASISEYTSNNTLVVELVSKYITSAGEDAYRIHGINASTGQKLKLVVTPGLTNVIDSYEIYIKKQKGESTSGISFTGLNYISTTSSTNIGSYISDINTLKKGDILRYEAKNNEATALERIYCVDDILSTDYMGHILNTGDNYGKPYRAGYRAFSGIVSDIKDNILEVQMGANFESFSMKASSVKKVIVLKGTELNSYDANLLPMYVSQQDRIFVVSLSGKASYIVVYK